MELSEEDYRWLYYGADAKIFGVIGGLINKLPWHPIHNIPQEEQNAYLNNLTKQVMDLIVGESPYESAKHGEII